MSRVTVRIDRITLPKGTGLDGAAFEAALRTEIAARLAANGGLGAARSVVRVEAGPAEPLSRDGNAIETVVARAVRRSLEP
jgi:hypothetical protein